MESCLVVAKITGLPGSSAVNNIFRNGPVNDVVLRLSPTVTSVCFLNQLKIDTKHQQKSEQVCFGQSVEFVFSPQHETSCDPETTTKEDADH